MDIMDSGIDSIKMQHIRRRFDISFGCKTVAAFKKQSETYTPRLLDYRSR